MTEKNVRRRMRADAVFGGGGVKAIGLAGALTVAEQRGYSWVNVAGTSAGAIIASLLAAGYSADELADIIKNLDYLKFLKKGPLACIPLLGPPLNLFVNKGIYSSDTIEEWLEDLLATKHVETFSDLIIPEYKDDPQYRYKLSVVASDISTGTMLRLPQDIVQYGMNPDELSVAQAVRMSLSIPYVFEPAVIKYRKHYRRQKSYIVDGGLLSNFPVWLFDSPGVPAWPTFGFKLIDPDLGRPHRIRGPISMLTAIVSTMLEAHDKQHLSEEHFVRTIPVPTLGISTIDFDISEGQVDTLFEAGMKAADEFFDVWDFSTYIRRHRGGRPASQSSLRRIR